MVLDRDVRLDRVLGDEGGWGEVGVSDGNQGGGGVGLGGGGGGEPACDR